MANLTQTLKTQSLNVFGPSPSTTWGTTGHGTMTWGTATWGYKAAGGDGVPAIYLGIGKVWTKSNTLTLGQNATVGAAQHYLTWSGTNRVTFAYENSSEQLTDGSGYLYVFIDRVTNAESAVARSTYTSAAAGASGWASASLASTTWSAV